MFGPYGQPAPAAGRPHPSTEALPATAAKPCAASHGPASPPAAALLDLAKRATAKHVAKMVPIALDKALATDKTISHVAIVHCETTTGILNPITKVGRVVRRHHRAFIVDAMSSFAAIPIDFAAAGVDFLISSANKCIEGVPGFCFVLCRRDALLACDGYARSLSLNLLDQLKGFDRNGQFRYTPPTHVILAFEQALKVLE